MKFTENCQRLLHELVSQEYIENGNGVNEAHFFELFVAQQIAKAYDLSDEEIDSCVLGGGNDGGCDAIFVLQNGNLITEDEIDDVKNLKNSVISLIIMQAKRETSFSEDTIMKWKTISHNLLEIGVNDSEYTSRYNEDVLNSFALFRELYLKSLRNVSQLYIKYYYASYATEKHPNVQSQADELIQIVKSLYPGSHIKVSVDFWGSEDLFEIAQRQPERKLCLQLAESPINIGTHHDYIALVNLFKYYSFITDENGELRKHIFESNVRDYQGHNLVNQDIQGTLESTDSGDFWWYNNGITLLTDEASLATNKELLLTDPAVVNGLQTSNEIYRFYKNHPLSTNGEHRNVLVRIIVPENEDVRDRIILATNNQTNIPKACLRANDPVHRQIELYFKGRGLYYDRRKNYYRNQGISSANIISVSFLAQCMMSVLLGKPNYARARPSTLLADDELYSKLYTEDCDLEVFYILASLGRKVKATLKGSSEYTRAQKNDILFYVLFHIAATLANSTKITYNDIKQFQIDDITEESIAISAQNVFAIYTEDGGNSRVAKGTRLIEHIKTQLNAKQNESCGKN